MVFNFLSGQFIDVIEWTDDTRDTMVYRFERQGHEIKYGAKLTVREGQTAVFIHEGQLADIFTPGLYMLETNNMPILTTLQHWDHGFKSPFKSEIYFVNTNRFTDLKWGTKNPIMLRDPEFGPTRIRAFGTYTVKVADAGRFMTEIVGTDGEFTTDEITFQIRNIIVQQFSQVVAGSGIPVLDMAANTGEFGKLVAARISDTIGQYGLTLPELYIENISLPARGGGGAGQAHLDGRGRRSEQVHPVFGGRGDAGRRLRVGRWRHHGRRARRGLGMAMGNMMMGAQTGPWGQAQHQPHQQAHQPAAAPPPPPVEHVWHIAENGATKGPFSKAAMGRMAAEGSLTRETFVWTAGQDGWMRAEDVQELAQLFTVLPPPPPPPPAG
jgi:membrane protease subunit (stomatin/prohibitin family)